MIWVEIICDVKSDVIEPETIGAICWTLNEANPGGLHRNATEAIREAKQTAFKQGWTRTRIGRSGGIIWTCPHCQSYPPR